MTSKDGKIPPTTPPETPVPKPLTPEARRALDEAEARRRARDKAKDQIQPAEEIGGRGGLDPARYGDWEKDGITSDF
jgi:hypothetical protein